MRIPSPARDLTIIGLGLLAALLAVLGVLPPRTLLFSVTFVVAASISFGLARYARRVVAERTRWLRTNRPDAVRVFRLRERAEGRGESFVNGHLLLNPGGVELVDPDDGRSFAMTWDEIGLVIAEPAVRGAEVLEAIVVSGPDDDVQIALLTPDLDAGASILAAWPGAVPLPADASPETSPEASPEAATEAGSDAGAEAVPPRGQ
ncbi:hypothetical protein [Cellulomonas soli]|uniref:hypothetical protein n=1 Tax=Cellulomonas soli TaxID=931535 RepID=UPI0015C8FBB0|nr:hypothetical protein [Cellulomonas soli]NYI59742.1 hypothetical protein [Cellulomonas soli]